MREELEQYQRKHHINYKNAIIDTISSNTRVLIDCDIIPLFEKPPLDSMDVIRTKILNCAKKNKMILSIDDLERMIDCYQKGMIDDLLEVGNFRETWLENKLQELEDNSFDQYLELTDDDFSTLRQDVVNLIEEKLSNHLQQDLLNHLDDLIDVSKNSEQNINQSFHEEITEYIQEEYPADLTKKINARVLVRDKILESRLNEHNERQKYLQNNSRILNIAQKNIKI